VLLLLTTVALASPPEFETISEPTRLLRDGSGTWPRLFPREDGTWFLVMANGGDLYWRTLNGDLSTKDESRHNMTNHAGLTDHALAQCPDGGIIDAASSYTSDWDDTLTVFRWDADFNLTNQYVLEKNNTSHTFADAAIICEEDFAAVGGFIQRDAKASSTPIYRLDPTTGDVVDSFEMYTGLTWFGAAWAWDGTIASSLRASTEGGNVIIDRIDPDTWEAVKGEALIVELDASADIHWFVRTLRWGSYWIVPFIHLSPDYEWSQGSGDIFLAVFNEDWSLVSTTRITDYGGGTAATQPWLTTDGEVIAVSWSTNNSPYGVILTLAEPRPEDTGEDTEPAGGDSGHSGSDTGGSGGSGDSGGRETGLTTAPLTEAPKGCGGCSSGGGLPAALSAVLPGLLWRRRDQYTEG
jgi:hypothetical protein